MMKSSIDGRLLRGLIGASILAVLLLTTGCSVLGGNNRNPGGGSVAPAEAVPPPSDFEDIRLPRELKPIKDQTFFMQTGGFAAGVLSLKGRVESHSLVSFFQGQMQQDNWQLVGFFKSIRSLMMFHKENRWCVINITEKDFYTYVEVWVAPTLAPTGSDFLK